MPAISVDDFDVVKRWIEAGSPVMPHAPLASEVQRTIVQWEQFVNGTSNKQRLFARYAFEHLYRANIWFESHGNKQYFKLVRSQTPSGERINELASRRRFDNPSVSNFYYRLRPVTSSIIDKTHMPYRFNQARMNDWREWFFEPDYEVPELPSYDPEALQIRLRLLSICQSRRVISLCLQKRSTRLWGTSKDLFVAVRLL